MIQHHCTIQQLSGHLFSVTGQIFYIRTKFKAIPPAFVLKKLVERSPFSLYHPVLVSSFCRNTAQTPHLSNHRSLFSPASCFYTVQLLMGSYCSPNASSQGLPRPQQMPSQRKTLSDGAAIIVNVNMLHKTSIF